MIAEEINTWLKVNGYPLTENYVRRWFELRYYSPPREYVVDDILRRIEQLRK